MDDQTEATALPPILTKSVIKQSMNKMKST